MTATAYPGALNSPNQVLYLCKLGPKVGVMYLNLSVRYMICVYTSLYVFIDLLIYAHTHTKVGIIHSYTWSLRTRGRLQEERAQREASGMQNGRRCLAGEYCCCNHGIPSHPLLYICNIFV